MRLLILLGFWRFGSAEIRRIMRAVFEYSCLYLDALSSGDGRKLHGAMSSDFRTDFGAGL